MNTLLDKMGLQKNIPPLAQSPPVGKRTASKRIAVPVVPEGILDCASMENSPHRPVRTEQLERGVSTRASSGSSCGSLPSTQATSSAAAPTTVGEISSRVPIAMNPSIGEFPVQDYITTTGNSTNLVGITVSNTATSAVAGGYQDVNAKSPVAMQSRT